VTDTSKISGSQVFKVTMSVFFAGKKWQDGEASSVVVLVPRFMKIDQVGNVISN
jgi:hypothetical protein